MVDKFIADADQFQVIKNDKIVFDTNRKSIQLFPNSTRIIRSTATSNPISIEFPDILKADSYWRASLSFGNTQCKSYITMLPQEWGPNEPNYNDSQVPEVPNSRNRRTLAREFLGTVPAGTDFIDVRAKLIRTVSPNAPTLAGPVTSLIPLGVEINLVGGSCPIELNGFARMFNVVLEGTNVYLDRYQSTRLETFTYWIPSNNDTEASGWTYGNASTGFSVYAKKGIPIYLIQNKGPDTNGNKRRSASNGTNRCAIPGRDGFVDPTNYRSVYTGDLIIHPGRRS